LIFQEQQIPEIPPPTDVEVRDIAEARRFYREVLGCSEGSSDETWLDMTLYGHRIVCHLNPQLGGQGRVASCYDPVDGKYVQILNLSVVLQLSGLRSIAKSLRQHGVKFVRSLTVKLKMWSKRTRDGFCSGSVKQCACAPITLQ